MQWSTSTKLSQGSMSGVFTVNTVVVHGLSLMLLSCLLPSAEGGKVSPAAACRPELAGCCRTLGLQCIWQQPLSATQVL